MAAVSMNRFFASCLKQTRLFTPLHKQVCCLSKNASFKYDDLSINKTTKPLPKPDFSNLLFGQNFSDHMLEIDWTSEDGWGKPVISPVHNFQVHPAAKVFHYAVELFEGLKAYRGSDNKIRLFRPDKNMERMNRTAARSTLPTFDGEELMKCIIDLVRLDKDWVPSEPNSSMYIRPTMIGLEPSLGVSVSNHSRLFVLTGPVGPYYPTGFKPVSLLADPQFVRAWEGGCGGFKMGANYAPTISIQQEAMLKHGCQQVLWLYGDDHKLTEVGTMNIFMYWTNEAGEEELVTPPLSTGIILPGVTRGSMVELAKEWGDFKVTEKNFTMKELVKGLKENRVKEIFGAGTACLVCPVDRILYENVNYEIPTMTEGAPITNRFLQEIQDIQYGRKPHPWAVLVE